MIRASTLFLFVATLASAQEASPISPEEYRARQEALRKNLEGSVGILETAKLSSQPGADRNTPLFNFKYLAGFHDPEGILVLLPEKTILFVADPEAARGKPVDVILASKTFPEWAGRNLAGTEKAVVSLRNPDTRKIVTSLVPECANRLGKEITRLRLVKSPAEMALVRKATRATVKAHREIMKVLRPGISEKRIQEKIEKTYLANGCPDLCFPSICGSGKNGTILHYRENSMTIPENSLIVCDIGAMVENYGTDITRTYPTSGKFTLEQRKAYAAVLAAQKAAEESLKPGITLMDLHRIAANHMANAGWKKWSFGHGKVRGIRHGIGHFVGMTVHDSGGYGTKLAPGMVVTLEPGWYDRDAGWGIRIEDMYLVTRKGFERLSRGAPREMDEIEKAMADRR